MINVPGATPSQLVLALGKDRNAYLINRNNLGGITAPVAQANMVSGATNRGTSAVTYHTSQGTYFAFHDDGNAISAYKITAANPPTIVSGWSVGQSGRGSPWVTTTDGTNNVIVWVAGVGGDQRLHGYNGDTGAVIYAGGGSNELMSGTRQWNTGMVARGRIYFGADNKVYAFRLPAGTPTPTPTATATATATPTATATATATSTPTATPTATCNGLRATVPPSPTPTATPTPVPTPTAPQALTGNQCDCQQLYRELEERKRRDWLPVGCVHELYFCHLCARVPKFGRRQHDESKRYRADEEHELLLPVTGI